MNASSRCRVVFLDAGTLPCGLPFAQAGLPPEALARLDYVAHAHTRPDDVAARIAQADVVVVNKVRLDAALMAAAPRLRRICIAAAGMDNVDVSAAGQRGIEVFNVPDYGSDSVAEHVIATLLALRRHLAIYGAASHDGRWSASDHFCWHGPRILPLSGSTLGIVGRGRIGQATARMARALGVRVLFAQRPGRVSLDDERPLDALLATCDAISLHLPLTPDTRGLIDARRLASMPAHAVLINTGRGALVDAPALADALRSGRLAGAAIDVLEVEPPPRDHPLLAPDIPNLLLTPHVAWASEPAQQRLAARLVERIVEVLA
ncbi:MAG: D-2-hydroxyacid dehydrogenase [Aquabacterium sp.]